LSFGEHFGIIEVVRRRDRYHSNEWGGATFFFELPEGKRRRHVR